MAILAIALLRLRTLPTRAGKTLPSKSLDDAVLLYTRAGFASEPDELSRIVRDQVGDVLDREHADPRGIFFIPDVAAPSARTYEAVIEEVGEGGVWGPLQAEESPLAAAAAAGGLGALLGGLLEQVPPSVLQSVGDAARGQPGALESASVQLRAAMAGSNELSGLMAQLAGAFGPAAASGGGPQLSDLSRALGQPGGGQADLNALASAFAGSGMNVEAMQQLAQQMESALGSDPTAAAAMVERMFGAAGEEPEDDGIDDADDAEDDDLDDVEDAEIDEQVDKDPIKRSER